MTYNGNVYYSPEKWGFEVVAEVEYSDGDYQFDTRVVWRDRTTGTLYTARDSGCSCPTPFEDFMTLADLEKLNYEDLEREVRAEYDADFSPTEGHAFLRTVRAALDG